MAMRLEIFLLMVLLMVNLPRPYFFLETCVKMRYDYTLLDVRPPAAGMYHGMPGWVYMDYI